MQDAHIDRGQRHIRLFARRDAVEGQFHIDRLARQNLRRRLDPNVNRAVGIIAAQPSQADGAGRLMRLVGFGRSEQGRGHIGARVPFLANRQFDDQTLARHGNIPGLVDLVAGNSHQKFALEGRFDMNFRDLADAVRRLVEGELQLVGHVRGRAGGKPAEAETHAGGRPRRGVVDLQPVSAPIAFERNFRGVAGGHIELAGIHRIILDRDPVVPGSVLGVPMIIVVLVKQLIAQPAGAGLIALAVHDDDIEGRILAFLEPGAAGAWLDADHAFPGAHRQVDRARNRAPAIFRDRHPHARLQRPGGIGRILESETHGSQAILVGPGGLQFLAARTPLFLDEAEFIAFHFGPGVVVLHQDHFALDRQTGARRAIKELRVDGDLILLARRHERRLGGKFHLHSLGHEVLDLEADTRHRGALGVDQRLNGPAAGIGRFRQRQGELIAAALIVAGKIDDVMFGSVGLQNSKLERQVPQRHGLFVTQQGDEVNGLAGAIDAAVGIDKPVDRPGPHAPVDATVRQVEGRFGHIQKIELAGLSESHHRARPGTALAAQQAGGKDGLALVVGGRRAQHVIVAGDQLDLGSGQGIGVLQRAQKHMQSVAAPDAGHAYIRNNHPLGGLVIDISTAFDARDGHYNINTGFRLAQNVAHGDGTRDAAVLFHLHLDDAFPHRLAIQTGDPL